MENDLIRRSEFKSKCIEVLEGIKEHPLMTKQEMHIIAAIDTVCEIIDDIPAVDAVEEKQGFWKEAGTGRPKPGNQRYRKQDQWTVYKCSNCGASNGRNHSDPYCRHCGARMLVDNCRYCYSEGKRRNE